MPSVDDTVLSKEVAPGVKVLLHTYWESWTPGYASAEVSVEQWEPGPGDIPTELQDIEIVGTERGAKIWFPGTGGDVLVGTRELFFDDTDGGVPKAWREGYFTGRDVVELYGEKFIKAVEDMERKVNVPPGFHSELGGSYGEGMSEEELGMRGRGARAMGAVAGQLQKRGTKLGKPGWWGEPGRHRKAAKKGKRRK